MINSLTEAISVALDGEFGDGYEIHMEEIRQGLKEPCFFISCPNQTVERFLGSKFFRTNQFCIQYFPETEEKRRECNAVAERMWRCLEYVTKDGDDRPVRGTMMRYEIMDDVLHFFVNYDGFVYRGGEWRESMDELASNTRVTEGGG